MRYTKSKASSSFISHSPHWVVAVYPFVHKELYYLPLEQGLGDRDNLDQLAMEVLGVFQIQDDVVQWQVGASKEGSGNSLSLALAPSAYQWVNLLRPDDWVIFWALDNAEDAKFISENLGTLSSSTLNSNSVSLNDFNIAPKFAGQITTISASDTIQPNGAKNIAWTIDALSFVQLNSSVYFDGRFDNNYSKEVKWHALANKKIQEKGLAGLISNEDAFMIIKDSFMGEQSPSSIVTGNFDSFTASPNTELLIPKEVAAVFGINKKKPSYADLLYLWTGVQQYDGRATQESDSEVEVFIPRNTVKLTEQGINTYRTSAPLKGLNYLQPLQFTGQTVYQIMQSYLTHPVNELYVAMKPRPEFAKGPDGGSLKIFPTLVARQTPLSTRGLIATLSKGAFDAGGNIAKSREVIEKEDYDKQLSKIQEAAEEEKALKNRGKAAQDALKRAKLNLSLAQKEWNKPGNQSLMTQEALVKATKSFDLAKRAARAAKAKISMKTEATRKSEVTQDGYLEQYYHDGSVTYFGSLPTWVVSESQMTEFSRSFSNGDKKNFLSYVPHDVWNSNMKLETKWTTLIATPVSNRGDAIRSGARTQAQQINTAMDQGSTALAATSPEKVAIGLVNAMFADILFNAHLKLTGQIQMVGMQLPIQVGDNIYIPERNLTFHIETVAHTGSIDRDGNKSFVTTLSLSNGMVVNDESVEYADIGFVNHTVSRVK